MAPGCELGRKANFNLVLVSRMDGGRRVQLGELAEFSESLDLDMGMERRLLSFAHSRSPDLESLVGRSRVSPAEPRQAYVSWSQDGGTKQLHKSITNRH